MAQPMDPDEHDLSACFEDFFRREYRSLVTMVMTMGGTLDDAHDATGETMAELWFRWPEIRNARAYARKAAAHYFIKQKQREREGLERAVKGGHLIPEGRECSELIVWEDKQWVDQLVCSLPRAQREVVDAIFQGLTVGEISVVFGSKPATIRRCLERATRRLVELRKKRSHGYGGGEIR